MSKSIVVIDDPENDRDDTVLIGTWARNLDLLEKGVVTIIVPKEIFDGCGRVFGTTEEVGIFEEDELPAGWPTGPVENTD